MNRENSFHHHITHHRQNFPLHDPSHKLYHAGGGGGGFFEFAFVAKSANFVVILLIARTSPWSGGEELERARTHQRENNCFFNE